MKSFEQILENLKRIQLLPDNEYDELVNELAKNKDLIDELEDLTDIAICKRRSSEFSVSLEGDIEGLAA